MDAIVEMGHCIQWVIMLLSLQYEQILNPIIITFFIIFLLQIEHSIARVLISRMDDYENYK